MFSTLPANPYPPSSEQMNKGDNTELNNRVQALETSITGILNGTSIDSFGDVETALATKANNEIIAPLFDETSGVYSVGDLVVYDDVLYQFTRPHETAGAWDISEVSAVKVSEELSTLKSGLTNLRNDVEGAWEELTFADVAELATGVTPAQSASQAFRRGNMIRLVIKVDGTLTIGADGYVKIADIKSGYRPYTRRMLAGWVNGATSGIMFTPCTYAITTTGAIQLMYGSAGTIGSSGHSWTDTVPIILEYALT